VVRSFDFDHVIHVLAVCDVQWKNLGQAVLNQRSGIVILQCDDLNLLVLYL